MCYIVCSTFSIVYHLLFWRFFFLLCLIPVCYRPCPDELHQFVIISNLPPSLCINVCVLPFVFVIHSTGSFVVVFLFSYLFIFSACAPLDFFAPFGLTSNYKKGQPSDLWVCLFLINNHWTELYLPACLHLDSKLCLRTS